MRKFETASRLLMFALLCTFVTAARAAQPPLPPGLAKYVMVLWPAGTPIPGDPGMTVKNLPEPDIEKLGGRVLRKDQNRRIILLPPGQAKGLRSNDAVVFLQRIWMGEPFAGWDETGSASVPSQRHGSIESDIGLTWGPKAYLYDGSGNIKQIGNDQFAYDSANRLISSQVSGPTIATKNETYSYDAFGNLTHRAIAGSSPVDIAVDGSSNRLQGVQYDAAGNVTEADDGHRQYQWDSAGSLNRESATGITERRIIYDASDERIGSYLVNDSQTHWTIRDFEGNDIREFDAYHYNDYTPSAAWEWYWEQDNFYGEGKLLAGETQPWQFQSVSYGGVRHYHLDHLGSVRMVTNSAGRAISEHDYYPYGTTATRTYQEELDWANNHVDGMRFGGHWRDYLGVLNVDNTEYIDFMHGRYYDPNLGRFLSVDPRLDMSRTLKEPQLWNRYAYALDDPIGRIDPDGAEDFRPFSVFWRYIEVHFDSHHGAPSLDITNYHSGKTKRASIESAEKFLDPIVHEGEKVADVELSNTERKLVIEAMKSNTRALRLLARYGIKLTLVVAIVTEVMSAEDANADEVGRVGQLAMGAQMLAKTLYNKSFEELTPEEWQRIVNIERGKEKIPFEPQPCVGSKREGCGGGW